MSHAAEPSETPNTGLIPAPSVRRVFGLVLGNLGVLLGAVATADGLSAAFDWSAYTVPAAGVIAFLGGAYGLAVTVPNIPKR